MKHVDIRESVVDQGDESVDGTQPSEGDQKVRASSGDKNVLRSKTAAFIVLGMAAVGLGFMTFFLTRREEISDFEEQVSSM